MNRLASATNLELDLDLPAATTGSAGSISAKKCLGYVPTPLPLVHALVGWAIRSKSDRVLDLGVGEGVFLVEAARRLLQLGATPVEAAQQLFGTELDGSLYERAVGALTDLLGCSPRHVVQGDFYTVELPTVNVVIGNPPYIRRHNIANVERARRAAAAGAEPRLADAYCYFLLRACRALQPGGRLAVVVSASWLDMRYGRLLKNVLLRDFALKLVLGFEGRVFADAQVKPVVVLAEKQPEITGTTTFARWKEDSPLDALGTGLMRLAAAQQGPWALSTTARPDWLTEAAPWSLLLKSPRAYELLRSHPRLVPLRHVAESRIGLQTFAKGFFVLSREQAEQHGIEPEFLLPMVFSPRDVRMPIIARLSDLPHVVFACDKPLSALRGTQAERYILQAERTPVPVRGKGWVVDGYHRAPRLQRAGRIPWYNVRTEIDRRGAFPVLLPRRTFRSYLVVHNVAGAVASENFIEVRPRAGEQDVEPLLAFFNSSLGEFVVRSCSFQYGGGVFNLNPGRVGELLVLNAAELRPSERRALRAAWQKFVTGEELGARQELDRALMQVLHFSERDIEYIQHAVQDLRRLSGSASRLHSARGLPEDR